MVRPFPYSLSSQMTLLLKSSNVQSPQFRPTQHKFKTNLSTVTRYELTHALHSVTFPFVRRLARIRFKCPIDAQSNIHCQLNLTIALSSTHQIARCYKIYAQFVNFLSTNSSNARLHQNSTQISTCPTKLLSYCYCSPLVFLVKYYYIRIITLFFYY